MIIKKKTVTGTEISGNAGGIIDTTSNYPDIQLKTQNGDLFDVVKNADNNESTVIGDITRPLHLDCSEDVILGKIDRNIDKSFIINTNNTEELSSTVISIDFTPPSGGFVTGFVMELSNILSNTQMKFIMKDKTDSNRIIYQVNVNTESFILGTDLNAYNIINGINIINLKSLFALAHPDEHRLEIYFNKNVTIKGSTINSVFVPKLEIKASEISIEKIATQEWSLDNGLQNIQDSKVPQMGFIDIENTNMVFTNIDRTFKISLKLPATEYNYYILGTKQTITSEKSITIPDTTGVYYIFLNNLGELSYASSFNSDNYSLMPIVFIRWNDVTKQAVAVWDMSIKNIYMPVSTRSYIYNRGTIYDNGFTIGNYSLNGDGSSDSQVQFSLTDGEFKVAETIYDMINSTNPINSFENIMSPICNMKIYYRIGTSSTPIAYTTGELPLKKGVSLPFYNKNTNGTWTLEETTDGKYISCFVGVSTDIRANNNIYAFMGQRQDDSLSQAQANQDFSMMDIGDFNWRQSKFLYRLIFKVDSTYTNNIKATLVDIKDMRAIETIQISASTVLEHNSLTNRNALHSHDSTSIDISTLRPINNSTTAIRFQNSDGTKDILTFDTSNNKVIVQNCFIPAKKTTVERNSLTGLIGNETVFDTDLGVLLSYDNISEKWYQI